MNPAPPKPPSKNAERKAWQAYFSELRRWAEALRRWEADLDKREKALEDAMEEMDDLHAYAERYQQMVEDAPDDEDDEDEMDCECDEESAAAGCDCPKCEAIREDWVEESRLRKEASKVAPDIVTKEEEMEWLENLWKLEDKRK